MAIRAKPEGQRHDVPRSGRRLRARDDDPENGARRRGDGAGRGVVDEPRHLVEEPDEEKLGRQRRHRQVEALDPEAGHAEHKAHEGGDETREEEDDDDVEPGKAGGELEGRVRPDGHEPARAEGHLPRVPGEEVQPDRRQRVDEKRDQHRLQPVLVRGERRHQERRGDHDHDEDPVLHDREYGLVAGVGALELPRFPVNHASAPERR